MRSIYLIQRVSASPPGFNILHKCSYYSVVDMALQRIPQQLRSTAIEIINQTKSSPSQKRALLTKKGLLRNTADEIEILASADEDVDSLLSRIEKTSPTLFSSIGPAVEEIKKTLQYARYAGFTRTILFRPLMLGNYHTHFKDGILFEVVKRNKRTDILAAGGR